jgi:hypothetical protein
MQPGEDRWVCLNFPPPESQVGQLLTVNVEEFVGDSVVNGFAIAARPAAIESAIREVLLSHLGLFTRAVSGFGLSQARGEVEDAKKLAEMKAMKESTYLEFLHSRLEAIPGYVKALTQSPERDTFRAGEAAEALVQATKTNDAASVCVAHTTFLNTLDSFLTMQELARGNPADILQNVRWQRELYSDLSQLAGEPFAATIRDQSMMFINAYVARKTGNKGYSELLRELLTPLQATAALPSLASLKLEPNVEEIKSSLGDLTALQKAHRGLLLKLQTLAK